MICTWCRTGQHCACPEVARQADPDLLPIDKVANSACYCAHEPGSVLRPDRKADPRRGA